MAGCIDSGVRDIAEHLNKNYYDYVECISWANGSTNLSLLSCKNDSFKLVFTPHSQPIWTLHGHERYFMTSAVFSETLRASDFVFIDSPSESMLPEFQDVDLRSVHYIPLGVDTGVYKPGSSDFDAKQILCVCDCAEARKRVDALLAAFSLAYKRDPSLRLVLGGRGSDRLDIPSEIAHVVMGLGYVSQEALAELYQKSAIFVLLTDYEAFGLPIAEALCCGCPVLLNELDVLVEIFSGLPGVTFTSNKDLHKTAELMCKMADGKVDRRHIARASAASFSFDKTYGQKRSVLLGEQDIQKG
jgi:glycosyltransferase involved in cell wall biosynthesis